MTLKVNYNRKRSQLWMLLRTRYLFVLLICWYWQEFEEQFAEVDSNLIIHAMTSDSQSGVANLDQLLADFKPMTIVIYDPLLSAIRAVCTLYFVTCPHFLDRALFCHVFDRTDQCDFVGAWYFLPGLLAAFYIDLFPTCSKEQQYLTSIRHEKAAFSQIIHAKSTMPLMNDQVVAVLQHFL